MTFIVNKTYLSFEAMHQFLHLAPLDLSLSFDLLDAPLVPLLSALVPDLSLSASLGPAAALPPVNFSSLKTDTVLFN